VSAGLRYAANVDRQRRKGPAVALDGGETHALPGQCANVGDVENRDAVELDQAIPGADAGPIEATSWIQRSETHSGACGFIGRGAAERRERLHASARTL
jgi:hypothetical protein